MSLNFDAAYTSLNAILVAASITVVVAMASAAIMHGLARAIGALGLDKLDREPAPGAVPVADDQAAIAVAIAAARRYHDTH